MAGLTLARRLGETICVGPEIEVTVQEIGGRLCRLKVKAPRTLAIWRKEAGGAGSVQEANRPGGEGPQAGD